MTPHPLENPSQNPQNPASIQQMFGKIARRYDLANHVLSLGLDYGWRKNIARQVALSRPQRILDLATGSGDLALTIRKVCPRAEVIAADFCLPMLAQAQAKNLPDLLGADGMHLPFAEDTFDSLTVAFGLRNMSSYPDAIAEFFRVLRPGGTLYILDFSMPGNGILKNAYRFYLRSILPKIAGLLTGDQTAYDYLGESIDAFPRGQEMIDLIAHQRGNQITCERFALGIVSLYRAEKSK